MLRIYAVIWPVKLLGLSCLHLPTSQSLVFASKYASKILDVQSHVANLRSLQAVGRRKSQKKAADLQLMVYK